MKLLILTWTKKKIGCQPENKRDIIKEDLRGKKKKKNQGDKIKDSGKAYDIN